MKEKINVLYIDENNTDLENFEKLFSKYYQILLANNKFQAKKHLEVNKIDIIISNHRITEIYGAKIMRELDKIYKKIPKIIITDYFENIDISDALSDKIIQKIVHKPYSCKKVCKIIEDLYKK